MFSNETLALYFDNLIGRVYKILPLKEANESTLAEYLDSLAFEMTGLELLTSLADQTYYTSILATISYFAKCIDDCDVVKVKREVFRMINLCKRLRGYYRGGGYNAGA